MKSLFIVLTIISSSLSLVPVKDGWRLVKSPLDTPYFQDILSKIYPPASKLEINRGSRIAGGEMATLGQFPYQTLLYNYDSSGDQYICGGAIITHRWILTVSFFKGYCHISSKTKIQGNFHFFFSLIFKFRLLAIYQQIYFEVFGKL
jgi:Trypsin